MSRIGRLKVPALAVAAFAGLGLVDAAAHDMAAMGTMRHGAAPAYAFGEPGKAAKVDRVIAITMHDMTSSRRAWW